MHSNPFATLHLPGKWPSLGEVMPTIARLPEFALHDNPELLAQNLGEFILTGRALSSLRCPHLPPRSYSADIDRIA